MIQNINIEGSSVTAEMHGNLYDAVLGESGVLNYGQNLSYEIATNNLIKIKDGLFVNKGRFGRIPYGSVEEAQIENGVSGVKRTDLIVIRFNTDGIKETQELKVLKGAPDGASPEPIQNEIYKGGTSNDMPLYEVVLNGLNIESVNPVFRLLGSITDLTNPKPNILINSDFKSGIINQKGETSYQNFEPNFNKKYTIDRWYIQQSQKLTVNSNSITVENIGTNQCYFKQDIESKITNCTLAIKVKSLTGSVVGAIIDTNDTNHNEPLKVGINEIKMDTNDLYNAKSVYIGVSPSSKIEIEFIKLERGSTFTGMPIWNYEDELTKCRRYFFKSYLITYGSIVNDTLVVQIPIYEKMAKSPSMSKLIGKDIHMFSHTNGLSEKITGINWITCDRNVLTVEFKVSSNTGSMPPRVPLMVEMADFEADANEY